jgi:hypothetical protein
MTIGSFTKLAVNWEVVLLVVLINLVIASSVSSQSSQPVQQTTSVATVPAVSVDYAWLDSVNLQLFRCSRALADGSSYTFYLVGEVHGYNEPSSRFADTLLARLQPGLFMSEGADSSQPYGKLMKDYSAVTKGFLSKIGYNNPGLSRLAKARNIPIVWLEEVDTSTGLYAGITESDRGMLASLVAALSKGGPADNKKTQQMVKKLLDDPEGSSRMFMTMMQKLGIDTMMLKNFEPPQSGILDTRNELMSAKAIRYIVPEYGCVLIRFGMAHSEGMIEELAKSGCECEEQSLQAFLEGD